MVKQWTDPFQKYCIFQVPRVLFLIRIEISSWLRSYKQYSELYASYILFLCFFFAYEGYGERPWTLRPQSTTTSLPGGLGLWEIPWVHPVISLKTGITQNLINLESLPINTCRCWSVRYSMLRYGILCIFTVPYVWWPYATLFAFIFLYTIQ